MYMLIERATRAARGAPSHDMPIASDEEEVVIVPTSYESGLTTWEDGVGWVDAPLAALRAERDRRLRASDWTQLADAPLTTTAKAAWRAYRKALRDLPATTDPHAVVWPEPPQ